MKIVLVLTIDDYFGDIREGIRPGMVGAVSSDPEWETSDDDGRYKKGKPMTSSRPLAMIEEGKL